MSVSSEIAAALAEAEAAIPQTVTISGTSYACSASAFTHTKTWDEEGGGASIEYDLSLSIRRSLFSGSIPSEGITASHRTKTFRIQRVIEDPTATFIRLICLSEPEGT